MVKFSWMWGSKDMMMLLIGYEWGASVAVQQSMTGITVGQLSSGAILACSGLIRFVCLPRWMEWLFRCGMVDQDAVVVPVNGSGVPMRRAFRFVVAIDTCGSGVNSSLFFVLVSARVSER